MPHQTPLRPGDPRGVGRYRVAGRLAGLPSDQPIFLGTGPDGAEVAISMLGGDWSHVPAARDRFAAEAAVAKRVPPFCAARVLDAGLDGGSAFLVSEYVAGPSLFEVVAQEGVRRGHDLEAVAIGMATGIASVHQAGLVHGRFGPEYVIMSADGSPRGVEFGITPPYGTATPSADMLAWAQTVVFAASGRPPVTTADLDVLPGYLREPVERCLDPEASQRPAARAVVTGLLGDAEIPAGVLAEGSRRATRPGARTAGHDDLAEAPRRTGTGQYPAREGGRPSGSGYSRPAAGQSRSGQHPPGQHPPAGQSQPDQYAYPAGGQARAGDYQPGSSRSGPYGQPGRSTGDRGPARTGSSHGHGAHPAGGGRRTWLIATATVVVLVLAGATVAYLATGSKPGQGSLAADSRHPSGSPSVSPAASSPSAGPVTPAGFAGYWSGQVVQPPTDTYEVSVDLKAGATTGKIHYSGTGLDCSGQLTLVTAASQKVTMSQGIIEGQSTCENGDVTIVLGSGGKSIRFTFHSAGPTAAGTLTRS
jgi:hypothetical protein